MLFVKMLLGSLYFNLKSACIENIIVYNDTYKLRNGLLLFEALPLVKVFFEHLLILCHKEFFCVLRGDNYV